MPLLFNGDLLTHLSLPDVPKAGEISGPVNSEAGAGVPKKLVADTDVQFSESFEIDGREMFEHACAIGLEGIVSKVRDSRCTFGRSNDWLKVTCAQRETL